jgi:hypothetical protein
MGDDEDGYHVHDDEYHDGGGGFSFWKPTGNMTTCRLQGFLLQLALGPPLYNAAVLWFAQLSIVHNWSNDQIARWVEMPTHICIWIWCLCSATLLLLHDKYHSVGPVCWASDPPRSCNAGSHPANDRQHVHLGSGGGDDDDDAAASSSPSCNIKLYSTVLYCIPLWSALVYTIISCCRINRHVHRKFVSPTSSSSPQHKHVTQRADSLVVLYSLAIAITYTPCLIWSLTLWNNHESFALTLLFGLLEPLQGVWNLAIFLMNRRQATRAKLRHLMTNVLCGPLVRCCPYPRCWSSNSATDPGNETNDERDDCYDDESDDTKSSTDHRSNLQLASTPASQQLSSDQQRPEPLALSSVESNSTFELSMQSNA